MSSGYQVFTFLQSENTISFFLSPALKKDAVLRKHYSICVSLVYVEQEKRGKESSALALRLYSYSKWESLNRARMSITTSLDLKSLGIFVGIACALRGETPPCRMYSCFYLQHRSVRVPTRTFSAKLHVVALNFFGAGLFYECSCINHYLQFKCKLTA